MSHDHRWLAYGTDRAGNEKYDLRFRSLEAETPPTAAGESVPETGYGLAWSAEGDFVFYVRMDEAQRPHQLWRHRLGADPGGDDLVFEETDRRFSLGAGSTRDDAFVLIGLHSTNTSEWLAIPSADPLAAPRVVMPRREGVEYAVDHLTSAAGGAGWFAALTDDGARDFRVVAAPDTVLGAAGDRTWREVVPHRPGVRVEDVDAFSSAAGAQRARRGRDPGACAAAGRAAGTPSRATCSAPAGSSPPSTARRRRGWDPTRSRTRRRCGSGARPSSRRRASCRWGWPTAAETLLKQEPVLGDFDPARYTTFRQWAVAPDGTRVPVSVVHRRGLELPAPCVLYGYGAYEISVDPSFSHHRLSLLDRGVVYAIAHVRGGGEMGRGWYEDGRMEHKANTFSDFIASGRHLVQVGIAPARARWRAGAGRPAGCSSVPWRNQAPELFRALVAHVPFVDCVTTMLDDELPLTVGEWEEWGNPLADESAYRRMLAYSPYDNVTGENPDGSVRTYPDLFVTAGLNDPRVAYWEPAKWVAKLRALSPTTRVLLHTELGAGHGGPSGRYDAWKEEALVLAFLLDALVAWTGTGPGAGA